VAIDAIKAVSPRTAPPPQLSAARHGGAGPAWLDNGEILGENLRP